MQFVRKLSGSTKPSKANQESFDLAVNAIEAVSRDLLKSLVTSSPPRNREVEAEKAKARSIQRFGPN